ncbi:RNA polymerase sigma factor [Gemmatimonadota bacterium]
MLTNDRKDQVPEEFGADDLLAARAGDHEAFSRFMDTFGDHIYRFARHMCGNGEDAEDILQETFLTAFRKLEDFRGDGTLKSWLFKITSSHCQKKRRHRVGEPDTHLSVEELSPEALRPITRGPSLNSIQEAPLESLLRDELAGELSRAIEAVPRDYRIVLLLRDVEGFTTRETMELTGLEEAAVKSRLHRARLMVRKSLQPYLEDTES